MLVTDFLVRKNEILKKFLNIQFDLVPESQLEEVPQYPLSVGTDTSTYSCPYCMAFMLQRYDCSGCPMYEGGNGCFYEYYETEQDFEEQSTWRQYYNFVFRTGKRLHTNQDSSAYPEILKLIEQYNYELENNINTNGLKV